MRRASRFVDDLLEEVEGGDLLAGLEFAHGLADSGLEGTEGGGFLG